MCPTKTLFIPGIFFSTRILTRSPPGSSCLRLRTCRICRWGWRCRPSERSPWPQCPELGNHMGLSQNGSKLWLWLFYGYFMVTLVGKIIFGVPLLIEMPNSKIFTIYICIVLTGGYKVGKTLWVELNVHPYLT